MKLRPKTVILSHRQRSYAGLDLMPSDFPCPVRKTRPPRPQEIESGLLGTGGKIWAEERAKMGQTGYWRRPHLPDPVITARTAKRYSLGETFHLCCVLVNITVLLKLLHHMAPGHTAPAPAHLPTLRRVVSLCLRLAQTVKNLPAVWEIWV